MLTGTPQQQKNGIFGRRDGPQRVERSVDDDDVGLAGPQVSTFDLDVDVQTGDDVEEAVPENGHKVQIFANKCDSMDLK